MGKTGYFTHRECWRHEMGPGHPECPARLDEQRALRSGLRGAPVGGRSLGNDDDSYSNEVAFRGTPAYRAPEILLSESPGKHDRHAADMYSFAVMLNAFFQGEQPFVQ